jgi:hypothetical protein
LSIYFDLETQPADPQLSLPTEGTQFLHDALHSESRAELHNREAIAARQSGGQLTLTIPADAIPTLAALVSRRLGISNAGGAQSGSYILADDRTCAPRLLVSIPPLEGSLRSLQPAHAPLAFPFLAGSAAAKSADRGENLNAPVLAIRFQAAWDANDSALVYPSAIGTPIFQRTMSAEERESILVSVIVPLGATTARTAQLLRSIANQSIADRVEIVAIFGSDRPLPQQSAQVLSEHFGGRYQVVTDDAAPASQLNKAASCANGTHLLFVEDTIILHDPRTLEALCLMAMEDRIATAACVTLQEKPHGKTTTVALASTGYLPARVSFAHAPHLVFSESVASAAMPTATYPVVSNAFRLALVRRSVWKDVGGLDPMRFPYSDFDLDFGLRAIKAGYLHLCTSATTAAYLGDALSGEPADLVSLAYLPPIQWQSVFNSSAVIKDLN